MAKKGLKGPTFHTKTPKVQNVGTKGTKGVDRSAHKHTGPPMGGAPKPKGKGR